MTEPSDEKYILRFEQAGHRDRIKTRAAMEKRSLNKQLLLLIEAGERVLYPDDSNQQPTTSKEIK